MKSFIIRLLQVIWILSATFSLIAIVVNILNVYFDSVPGIIGGFFGWSIFLMIIQYLIFAKLDPRYLFDGSLKNEKLTALTLSEAVYSS